MDRGGFYLPPTGHAGLASLACEAASPVVAVGLNSVGWVARGGLDVGSDPCVVWTASTLKHTDRRHLSSVGLIGRAESKSSLFTHTAPAGGLSVADD